MRKGEVAFAQLWLCDCGSLTSPLCPQELTAIKARVQELEMEEETERLKEDERCDAGELQLMTCSPRPGETAQHSFFWLADATECSLSISRGLGSLFSVSWEVLEPAGR